MPLLSRLFFVLCGIFLAVCAAGLAAKGDGKGALVAAFVSLLLASLYFLESRTLLDEERKEVFIRFRWTFLGSDRRVALAAVANVYLRSFGKWGREMGLKLTDGSELPLCQPMGYESDKQDFAQGIARRLGVTVVEIPPSDAPATNGQLVLMNVILSAVAAALGFVAWLAATRPATDGRMAWPVVWILVGISALILTVSWHTTLRAIRRRRKG